jgi:hypothetical protein
MRAPNALLLCLVLILFTPRSSAAQGSIDGFGGLSYAEASAGIARVSLTMGGFGPAEAVTRAALSLLDSTDPVAGFGGGLMFRGGQDLRSHQVRFGLGVRF